MSAWYWWPVWWLVLIPLGVLVLALGNIVRGAGELLVMIDAGAWVADRGQDMRALGALPLVAYCLTHPDFAPGLAARWSERAGGEGAGDGD